MPNGIPLMIVCGLLCGNAGLNSLLAEEPSVTSQQIESQDWPWFLGPHHTGLSNETNLLEPWPAEGPPVLWKKTVGTGYSAPSIRGNRLVLHHRINDNEIVECFRPATGEPVWKFEYPTAYSDPYGYNNGPRCSPLLTENRCYTFGAEGKLLCLNLETGEKIWMRDVKADFEIPDWFFGIGCTPVLEGNLLIALVGGQPNSAVVAFNADSGETAWQSVGKETWDGVETGWPGEGTYKWTGSEMLVSYSSPLIVTIHDQRHLLCLVRQGLVSLDPQTGKTRFKFWFRSRTHESVNASRPVVVGDQIFLTASYRTGAALLKVHPDSSGYDVVWQDQRGLSAHWSTPIHVDGYVYGFSGRHEPEALFQCVELATGKLKWETTGFEGDLNELGQDPLTGQILDRKTGKVIPWPFYGRASKIQVGNKFIVMGERGTLALVKINPEKWEELSRVSYPEITVPSWTAPVLSRKRLYLRDEDSLICLDLAPDADE